MLKGTFLILCALAGICRASWKIGVLFQTDDWTNFSITDSYDLPGTCDLEYTRYNLNGSDPVIVGQTVYNISAEDILGLIAFTSYSLTPVVREVANVLNTPLINVVQGHCPKINEGILLSAIPNCHIQNSLFTDIALYMRWRRVNIIYDFTGEVCIQDFVNRFSVHNISSKAVFLRDGIEINLSLVTGQRWLKEVIYVTTDKHTALEIVSEAMTLGMFNNSYFWVLNLDLHDLWDRALYKPVHNGYVLVVTTHRKHNRTQIIDNLLYEALLIFHRGLNLTKETCHSNESASLASALLQYLNSVDSVNSSLSKDGHFRGTSELRVYSTVRNSRTPLQEVGVYTPGNGLLVSDKSLYRNVFKGFDNRTLRVVSVVGEPFQMRVEEGNGSFHFYGFTYDLLDEFSKEFNFRYQFLDSVDGLYGNPTEDGKNATGMVGMVMRGEADIAVGGITITVERKAVVDFLYPYQEEGIGIIMRKVDDEAGKMFRVFSPLGSYSWLASGVAVLVAGVVLSLIAKLSPFDEIKESVLRSFWLAFSTFLHQGEENTPKSASGRIVLGIWWIFTIIVMSLYTANLAAFLTVSLAKAPVKNLEQLSSQTVYKPLVKDGTNLYALFQNAEGGLYKKIWDMMADMPKITESEEGYKMILKGKYAYLTDESEVKYKAMLDCKHLEVAKETFHKAELSFVIRKDAEFKEAFNNHMLKMVEGGIVDKYRSKWWPKYKCDISSPATELTFESTSGIFIVYSGFILISVTCCLIELLLIQGRKHTRNKVQSPQDVKEIALVMVDC
ncbi:glutamate receptor ionotropic, kainate 3-like [Saccostrea echinata]|uniref:glutamate receptor ionotropic, kainate 3-like n=1 Tax=Saccostrea echinata TaxID=191078 RepID=UPI002A80B0F1|nr:glutamate receptor ionotropic, kainate 3-like [Saccostrea echinata]